MSLSQLRTVNFGKSRTGLTGTVGFTLYNNDGTVNTARNTAGIYEVAAGSGIYASYVSFPDDFRGSIYWDSGEIGGRLVHAIEQYNYEENNPNVDLALSASYDISGSVQEISASIVLLDTNIDSISTVLTQVSGAVEFIKHIEGGRWIIDETVNQMIFYEPDNVTEVARFNLYDITGSATSTCVYERVRV
jgi:hypothetical protein